MCNVLYNEDMFVCLRFVWGFTAQSVLLRSCWASQLIYSHCSWAVLGLLSGEPVLSAHTFASNWQLPFLNQWKGGNGCSNYLSRLMTKWLYTQQRLRSTWASTQSDQSSMSAWRKLGSLATHWAHSEDSDQTGFYHEVAQFHDQSPRYVGLDSNWQPLELQSDTLPTALWSRLTMKISTSP